MKTDSIEKILYKLSSTSLEPIYYQGKLISEQVVSNFQILPSFFRTFICPPGCHACCLNFSIDFLPCNNINNELLCNRTITVNSKEFTVTSYFNEGKCNFLKPIRDNNTLGCSLFPLTCLSCAEAPQIGLRKKKNISVLMKTPYGRAWAFKLKPQCKFINQLTNLKSEINLLKRYLEYANYFKIKTILPEIIDFLTYLSYSKKYTLESKFVLYKNSKFLYK